MVLVRALLGLYRRDLAKTEGNKKTSPPPNFTFSAETAFPLRCLPPFLFREVFCVQYLISPGLVLASPEATTLYRLLTNIRFLVYSLSPLSQTKAIDRPPSSCRANSKNETARLLLPVCGKDSLSCCPVALYWCRLRPSPSTFPRTAFLMSPSISIGAWSSSALSDRTLCSAGMC